MALSDSELEHLCSAYLSYQTAFQANDGKGMERHEDFWAVQQLMLGSSGSADPEDAWREIRHILAQSPSDEILSVLAAGPLEDLIQYAGDDFIGRIEVAARQDPTFRELLSGVWETGKPDVWSRIAKARGTSH